jgi:hypothetical protein
MISLKNLLLAFLSLLCLSLHARETKVSNASELDKAISSASAGDVLVMEKGFWQDACILISKGGTASRPLVIRAEVPGETILCGSSRIEIKAPYVTIDGLFFKDGAIDKGAVVEFRSDHGDVEAHIVAHQVGGAPGILEKIRKNLGEGMALCGGTFVRDAVDLDGVKGNGKPVGPHNPVAPGEQTAVWGVQLPCDGHNAWPVVRIGQRGIPRPGQAGGFGIENEDHGSRQRR